MNSLLLRIALAAALAPSAGAVMSQGQEAEDPLKVLDPLLHKTWVGGFVEGSQTGLKLIDTWTTSLEGKAVVRHREIPERSFAAETIFYWDKERGSIAFLGLNTKGDVHSGAVSKEGDLIVIKGRSVLQELSFDFKTTLEILPDGRLRDFFYSLQGDAWVQRHHQEFTPQAPAGGGS